MQNWLEANGFTEKNEWRPNSPDLNSLDYHVWGAMLEKYHRLLPKPKTTDELKAIAEKSCHKNTSTTWPRRTSSSAWVPTWLLLPTVTVSGECGRQTGNSSCHKTERRDSVRVGWPAERRPARGSQRFIVSRLIMQTDTCQCHRSHSNHRPKALIVNAAIRSAPLYIFHASLGRTLPAGACVWSYPESAASVTAAAIKYLGTLVADRYRQV